MRSTAVLHADDVDPCGNGLSRTPGVATSFGLPYSPTSFVGRERDIEELCTLIREPNIRLLTLTGPGGVGKTRLALRVAGNMAPEFDLGAGFVPLAAIDNPLLVPAEIGRVFDLADSGAASLAGRIASVLDSRSILLVLDNFEHVADAAPILVEIISVCPTLTILTTSRTVLNVSGERKYGVRPLDLPDQEDPASSLGQASAVRLFLERAHLSDGELPDDQTALVTAICQHLDGLPLAIELAAAKTRVLPLADLLRRLHQRLLLLADGPRDAPPRLRSMRDAISWSYELLDDDEKLLFRTLSVFDGGWTLEAAEGLVAGPSQSPVLDGMTSLINHHLVYRVDDPHEGTRYGMLETLREFGIEELNAHGEVDAVRERHLHGLIDRLGNPGPRDWIRPQLSYQELLPGDQNNLRAALDWALDHGQVEQAVQIAYGLRISWFLHGLNVEADETMNRILAGSPAIDPALVAALQVRQSLHAHLQGDLPRSMALSSAALKTSRESGDPEGIRAALGAFAYAVKFLDGRLSVECMTEAIAIDRSLSDKRLEAGDLVARAFSSIMTGELEPARGDVLEAIAIHQTTPVSALSLAMAHAMLSWIAGRSGEIDEAEQHGRTSLELSQSHKLRIVECLALRALGHATLSRGQYGEAFDRFQQAYKLIFQSAMFLVHGFVLSEVAIVAGLLGDQRRSARLHGAARASWNGLGVSETTIRRFGTWNDSLGLSDNEMDDPAYRDAFDAGMRLSHAECFAEVMAIEPAERNEKCVKPILSRREFEVLQLIAQLHTNKEIADRLFISKRTVDRHVLSILSKLAVDNRRAAVGVARDRGLLE